jgi:hypothetical protein
MSKRLGKGSARRAMDFRGNLVLIEPYDGFTKPSLIELFSVDIWIRIHDLLVRYAPMVKSLASKVGKFI